MRKLMRCALAAGIGLAAASAMAVVVADSGGELVFDSRGFEYASDPTTYSWSAQQSPPPSPTDSDPDGQSPGGYSIIYDSGGIHGTQVTSSQDAEDPGPHAGANYLRVVRPGGAEAGARMTFTEQSSGNVHIEFYVNLSSLTPQGGAVNPGNFVMILQVQDAAQGIKLMFGGKASGEVAYYAGSWTGSGLTCQLDTWQLWTVDYVPGASTFILSVDGNWKALSAWTPGNIGALFFRGGADATRFCLDGAPMELAHYPMVSNNGVPLMVTDFERGPASPYTYAEQEADGGKRSDSDPHPGVPGTWEVSESTEYRVQQTTSTTSPDPGPIEGDTYLRVHRPNGEVWAAATFPDQSNGTVKCDFMYYHPVGEEDFMFRLSGSTDNGGWTHQRIGLLLKTNGDILNYFGGWPNTGKDFVPGKWERWIITYSPGASTYSFSVDGRESGPLNVGASGDVAALLFRNSADGSMSYVDTVPPPTEPMGTIVVVR